ncbi:MAG: hypothetical protein L6Q35_01020 [Phycisphaerales bacterium]|nr:hypothetical protein [Phycisphaerales bacterium]
MKVSLSFSIAPALALLVTTATSTLADGSATPRTFGPSFELPAAPAASPAAELPDPSNQQAVVPEQPEPQPTTTPAPKPQPALTSQPSPAHPSEARPLGAPAASTPASPAESPASRASSASALDSLGIGRTAAALAGVVALAIVLAAAVRAAARRKGGVALGLGPAGRAPSGVVHVLARYPLQRGQLLVLLKVGPRVLLVCQSRPGRLGAPVMNTLAEFSDPDEVASLVRLTESGDHSAVSRFRTVLDKAGVHAALPPAEPARPPASQTDLFSHANAAQAAAGPAEDRVELSAAAQARARSTRTRTPRGYTVSQPAGDTNRVHPQAHDADLDGAEQLRKRLARLRSGMPGEAS